MSLRPVGETESLLQRRPPSERRFFELQRTDANLVQTLFERKREERLPLQKKKQSPYGWDTSYCLKIVGIAIGVVAVVAIILGVTLASGPE